MPEDASAILDFRAPNRRLDVGCFRINSAPTRLQPGKFLLGAAFFCERAVAHTSGYLDPLFGLSGSKVIAVANHNCGRN